MVARYLGVVVSGCMSYYHSTTVVHLINSTTTGEAKGLANELCQL